MAWDSIKLSKKLNALFFIGKYPIIIWMTTCAIFAVLLVLLRFPLNALLYGIALSGLVVGIWLLRQWFKLKQHHSLLTSLNAVSIHQAIRKADENDLLLQASLAHYQEAAKGQAEMQQAYQHYLSEQKDYFTLWLHQIKTPIASISLLLQQETIEESRQTIKDELLYLTDYTHMGLNYLKLADTGHELDLTTLAVDPLVKNVLKKYASLFIYQQIKINYAPLQLNVLSDAKWLQVLLEQIISNSLKYTPQGGEITIAVIDETKIMIKDTGIGIHANDLPKIFEKGYSGLNGRMQDKSSGLGLFLARKICQRLNYSLTIESEVGRGTSVFIETARDEIEVFD